MPAHFAMITLSAADATAYVLENPFAPHFLEDHPVPVTLFLVTILGGVFRAEGTALPNTIAAVLLAIRDRIRRPPHVYFGWAEGNPLKYLGRFIFFGEGDITPTTREILRKAEPDPGRRPVVHVW